MYADRLWWEQQFDRAHFFRWHRLLGLPETCQSQVEWSQTKGG